MASQLKDAIRAAYSPTALVVSSKDAEELCARNSLNITTLLRPFCEMEPLCWHNSVLSHDRSPHHCSDPSEAASQLFPALLHAGRARPAPHQGR